MAAQNPGAPDGRVNWASFGSEENDIAAAFMAWGGEKSTELMAKMERNNDSTSFGSSMGGPNVNVDDLESIDRLVEECWEKNEGADPPEMKKPQTFKFAPLARGQRALEELKEVAIDGQSNLSRQSDRFSENSFASTWKSSMVSFSSEVAEQPAAKMVIGRTALPSMISVSTIQGVPKTQDGSFLSIGSRLHETGECTPCKFFRSARGCRDATLCKLCHYPHDDLSYSGIRKAARQKGIKRREFFDVQAAQPPPIATQKTFIHFNEASEDTTEEKTEKKLTRSGSWP